MQFAEKYCEISYASPIGNLLLVFREDSLCGLRFAGETEPTMQTGCSEAAAPATVLRFLDDYFAGRNPQREGFRLAFRGTPFQQLVWEEIQEIPYGSTVTYGEIAQRVARKTDVERMSAQAVGQAVGRNPVAIIVPCHRVVGAGGPGGYAWGLEKKRFLLELEGKFF